MKEGSTLFISEFIHYVRRLRTSLIIGLYSASG